MSYINPFQDTSGNLSFSSNSTSILDKSLYYNFWNDINQKPSFCNIAFSADYIDISNKPNLNPLSTSSNLYYSSNSYHSSFSNLNYSISNSLINFTDNKLNNLNSSLWGTIGNHIYSNLGSVGIGTSSLGNNKLVIKGNLKSDDLKIKGMGFSNLLITSNILDNKSNLLYTSISNQDYLSKNKQITSSQFTTDINNNLYIINSNIGIGTSSNLINDMILINGNTNIYDFKIKGTSSSNLLITSNILDNSSNYLIENFNSNFNKYSSSIWSNSTNSSIYITSNLGIGSTIPNQILDIYGNIRISGSILPNSCNSFDLGSLNKKWKDLYISGNSIYLNDFIIRNSNNYLNISNIDVSSINFLNNLNTNSNIISLNTNGDFMIGNKYLLGINGNSSNIIFSNVLSNSSNSLINLNNSKFNSSNSTDLIKIANKRFITNDIYNRPATFSGILESYNLTTSNLNVIGDYTNFNTTIYQTEQLFIENSCNYPAMIIKQMNINKNVAEFYNSNYSITNVSVSGTGNSINNVINDNNYKYALFNSNGTFSTDNNIICDILIVGGGGGGGKSDLTDGNNGRYGGGGGGSGDVIYIQNYNLNKGSYSINIGSGGSGGTGTNNSGNGTNTTIIFNSSTLIGAGGGGGGADAQTNSGKSGTIISSLWGTSSGGGGGGGGNLGNGGNGNTYSGNGANGKNSGEQVSQGGGGGGGPVVNAIEINGGLGLTINIIGTNIVYGGGAGGQRNYSWVPGSAGGTGYGSGGGTSQNGNGGSGKTGVVIIRYAIKNPDIQMKFLVNSNGNIGIGTNIPVSKLDVIGSINSKGLVVNNNEIINQIKTNDSNYSNSLFYSWNYSNNLFLSLSNSIENIKNSKQDLLNSSTILLGNGANITNVNYNNLINKPDLSIYSTSVNSTSNFLFINVSNIDYYSSNSNISYVNNETDNLIKFLWNTNGNNVFTNSNIGIGSFIPSSPLDINGNFNTNELLIKKGNLSNFFITSNIFDNRSNNYYSSLSNLDYNSSNSNVIYVNNIVNTAINNYNSYLDSIDLWKTSVNNGVYINSNINILDNIFSLGIGSLSTSITSTCNSLVLSQNSIIKYNYTNDTNINSGTYNVVFNNGSITFGGLNPDKSYPILSNLNPIVWYKFDDNSNDMIKEVSLNVSSNLVLFNNPTFDSVNYTKGNGSIYFNNPSTASTQIYATIPTNVLPASYLNSLNIANGLSFSFWIKLSSSSIDYGIILYFGNFQSGSPYYDNTNYRLQIRTSSPKTSAIYFDIVKDGFYTFQYNANMYDDTWKHIIWTISSSGNWNIYVNNSIICNNQSKFVFPLLSSTNLIYILGVDKHPTNYGIIGNFDDFRIYSQVLNSNQVQELYNGRVDIYNYIPVNNYSSNLLIKGDMNITGNLKLNNNLLKLIETPTISITGTGNSINIATDDSNYRYALFNSNGTFSVNNNIICDILVVGGGGSGGTRAGGGGGAGSLIYKTNQILNSGFYSVTIGNGGAGQPYSTTTSYIGNDGGDTLINFNGINIYIAKGGGGGAYNLSSLGRIGGSCGGNSTEQPQTPLAIPYNIQNEPDGIYGNQGGGGGLTGNDGYAGGGGGGAGSVGGTITTTNAGNGGSGLNINITGVSNLYAGGGGGGAGRYNSVIAGTGGSGIGGVGGTLSTTPGENGLANTGSGGGGSGFGTLTNEWDNNGASGSGGSGVVIIRYTINQPVFSGAVNYSNIRNRPYLLDLLTSSNIINVGEENNINFPLSITSWKNEWFLFIGTSPTNIPNSFIFHHITPTINSKWWFNGTTSTTKAEISDERIKKEINDLSNGLHKLMLLNPKEYFLCDDKDYHKKYGIIAQDVSQIPELSHLVHKDTDFIANIYSSGSYDNSNGIFIITSSKKIDGLIEINDELKILLDNKENPEIIIEELPYDNRYKKRFVKVKNIINDFSFEIFDDIELNEFDKSNLFIYGKKINDFLKLDYNSLYTLNIKANQEIYDIINNSYNTLNNLTTRIKILEDKLS